MKPPHFARFAAGLVAIAAFVTSARAQFVYLTDFTKTNNIYTNLNEEFPHSGTGTPGSGVGTANASFIFDPGTYTSPDAVGGANVSTNGVVFQITSDANGHDFAEINASPSLVIPVGQQVAAVYLLMAAYNGTTISVTFTGADNATETFSGVSLPDFNGGAPVNSSAMVNGSLTANLFNQTVFRVQDTGAGGTGNSINGSYNIYDLVEPGFVLDSQLSSEPLSSITITSSGYMSLLLGATVTTVPEPSTLALLAAGVGLIGAAGLRKRARKTQDMNRQVR